MSGKQSENVKDHPTSSQLWGCDCKYKCIHEENYQRIVKELLDLVDNDENQISNTNSNKSNSGKRLLYYLSHIIHINFHRICVTVYSIFSK